MTMAPINKTMITQPPSISGRPIDPVEAGAEFVRFLFAGDERTEPQGANDNENDDEGAEETESN